jgi:general secretion pathway protein G
MKIHTRRGRAAFTLIELMAVITIIVILAGIVVGGLGYVNEKQAREKAKVQLALISKALEEYKLDNARYPGKDQDTAADGTITNELYEELFYEGYDYTKQNNPTPWEKTVDGIVVPKATKIYLPELDPTASKQGWMTPVTGSNPQPPVPGPTTKIKDPWGNEYRYRKGTNAENPDFDLWSAGKDGKSVPGTASDPSNKDDIRNF